MAVVVPDSDALLVGRRCDDAAGITWQFPAGVIKPRGAAETTIVRKALDETGLRSDQWRSPPNSQTAVPRLVTSGWTQYRARGRGIVLGDYVMSCFGCSGTCWPRGSALTVASDMLLAPVSGPPVAL